jgi:hypothetical protein
MQSQEIDTVTQMFGSRSDLRRKKKALQGRRLQRLVLSAKGHLHLREGATTDSPHGWRRAATRLKVCAHLGGRHIRAQNRGHGMREAS